MAAVGLTVIIVAGMAARIALAADPAFVGVLALAVDDEGARRLGLSDETRQKLLELIDRREREALSLALALRDIPPAERAERLAPFVRESERQGMALLTVPQRELLNQMRIQRAGMLSLGEEEMAVKLDLTDEQKAQVKALLDERAQAMAQGGDAERRKTHQHYERELAKVLSDQQRATWEAMAGLGAGSVAQMAETPEPTEEAASEDVSPEPPPTPSAPEMAAESPSDQTAEQVASELPERERSATGEVLLRFNFHHQPWQDVLEWFAEQADLSLQLDAPPPGTFNYRDERAYTPAQALDLLNSVLLTKGFTLVRRERLLLLVNLEDEIPPQLVEMVPLSELDKRGSFELVKCVFQLAKMSTDEAEGEISRLIGPQGSIVSLPLAGQLVVTETAGRLRTIRDAIEAIENPKSPINEGIVEIPLQYVGAEEFLSIARPLLGIEPEQNANDQIRIAVDPFSSRLFATGEREALQKLREIVPLVDRAPTETDAPVAPLEQPQLETYQIVKADPQMVFDVMQTMLAGLPDVRLSMDPMTNKLIAMARPSEHRTIQETLRRLEGEAETVEVIQLRKMDPQLVILTINKLFGISGEEDAANTTGPKVDGDPLTHRLWVRGTQAQIDQIKELVQKLEGEEEALSGAVSDNIRILPFSGTAAQTALENARMLWPALRENRIRVVTPSAISPSLRQRRTSDLEESSRVPQRVVPGARAPASVAPPAPAAPPVRDDAATQPAPKDQLTWFTSTPAEDDQTGPASADGTAESQDTADTTGGAEPADETRDADEPAAATPPQDEESPGEPAEIIIAQTPNGLVIASRDARALDEFESFYRSLVDQAALMPSEPTVYWLKYVKADVAAETLNQILSGVSASGDGSLLGDVASSVLGDVGGGIVGALLEGDSTTTSFGAASIVPDVRLNALIVQGSPADLHLIEQLLPIIDREASPEDVQTQGKPRLIPVVYMPAEEMAEIVRQVFANQIQSTGQSGGQRGPSPEDIIRALRGGRGGPGGSRGAQNEPPKMTIGVDARSNSLIVAAPEPLFEQVQELVAQLDNESILSDDTVQVISLKGVNPEVIQQALAGIVGGTTQSSSSSSSSRASSGGSGGPSPGGTDAEAIRRRIEFIRNLQQRFGGGGPGGSSGGGPFGGFRPGGFGGGGPGGFRGVPQRGGSGPTPSRGRGR